MRLTSRLGLLVAAGAFAVAAPALAHSPSHPAHPNHPATSKKCTAHNVAYRASGTIVSWDATANTDGTYTGTVTVAVTKANHHAKSAKGTTVTYTLTNTKVRFGTGGNPPAAGDRVRLKGSITEIAKKCTDQTGAGSITIRRVEVKGASDTK